MQLTNFVLIPTFSKIITQNLSVVVSIFDPCSQFLAEYIVGAPDVSDQFHFPDKFVTSSFES